MHYMVHVIVGLIQSNVANHTHSTVIHSHRYAHVKTDDKLSLNVIYKI